MWCYFKYDPQYVVNKPTKKETNPSLNGFPASMPMSYMGGTLAGGDP